MFNRHNLSINLENDHIILRGNSQESAGYVLRGYLLLQLCHPTKIKSIELTFFGHALIHETRPYKNTIIEKKWNFIESMESPCLFKKGKYEYHFELPLNGNIPESVCTQKGYVSYQFKAIVRKTGLRSSIESEQNVNVERSLGPLSAEPEPSLIRTGDVQGQMKFYIVIPCSGFITGQDIPVMLGIRPMSRGIKVFKVYLRLREATRYRTFFEEWSDTHEGKIDEVSCVWRPKLSGWWEQALTLKVPKNRSSVRADSRSRYIHIWHFIEVQISLIDLSRKKRFLTVHVPVHIFSDKLKASDEVPPAYEDALAKPPDYLSSLRRATVAF
ncbi:hypothetical protein K493DRAFT_210352 [Basidiobolus meristosporus CBS 931.73]|uniref:Arrestin C-terminal-like domain-containing protein n=1 Tax=Basidiobolus meristosporus CBS 931.73 TaxID=1314790 RepID=A0A1Y1YSE4_9FUNG|nr:hypothetical protein K493DRAFT_210352 [Basidiobolus meristosporus CBS 931.73]|eukprot:ORY00940.1 hypothetical protein K493DRAFT_210352 [Basidiobolus meristosporus CBS 931.73]